MVHGLLLVPPPSPHLPVLPLCPPQHCLLPKTAALVEVGRLLRDQASRHHHHALTDP